MVTSLTKEGTSNLDPLTPIPDRVRNYEAMVSIISYYLRICVYI